MDVKKRVSYRASIYVDLAWVGIIYHVVFACQLRVVAGDAGFFSCVACSTCDVNQAPTAENVRT